MGLSTLGFWKGDFAKNSAKLIDGRSITLYEAKDPNFVKAFSDVVTDVRGHAEGRKVFSGVDVNDVKGFVKIDKALYPIKGAEQLEAMRTMLEKKDLESLTELTSQLENTHAFTPAKKIEAICTIPKHVVHKLDTKLDENVGWGKGAFGIFDLWPLDSAPSDSPKVFGKGVKVAVLDTGIDSSHPDLQSAILEAKDFTESGVGALDRNGHGTHVAGTIAARINGEGNFGVAPQAKLLVGKVLKLNEETGRASSVIFNSSTGDSSVSRGIKWAIARGANVISMSLGGPWNNPASEAAIAQAVAKGIIVIAAAGNAGPFNNRVDYPGRLSKTLSVGSLNRYGNVSLFSSNGRAVDVIAPGEEIDSTYLGGGAATLSGTSMATPFVAGLAALWVEHKRNLGEESDINQTHFMQLVSDTAQDIAFRGEDERSGKGLINPPKMFGMSV